MTNQKPKNIDEYIRWLKKDHGVEISDRTRTHYEYVTNKVRTDFEKSNFWVELTKNLRPYSDDYLVTTGYHLLIPGSKPELDIKPFDSFLFKTFGKNVLENKQWCKAPSGGWILPDNWYTRINDIIRTLIIVKYLDGVEFLTNKIDCFCAGQGAKCRIFFEAREEGYYAAHSYTKAKFEIPKISWETEKVDISIEIQITTQLQEVIRKLLHKYYEQRRQKLKREDVKWQWDYESDEFLTNYLGHILHYVEGMIMEIREKQKEDMT